MSLGTLGTSLLGNILAGEKSIGQVNIKEWIEQVNELYELVMVVIPLKSIFNSTSSFN